MKLTKQQKFHLESLVDTYEDFPGKGVSFKDLSLIYTDVNAIKIMQDYFSSLLKPLKPDCIIGCDARGFIIGSLIAQVMQLPFIMARKPGKLPGELLKKKYGLEYGTSELQMHRHIIMQYKSPVIADDVLATGGTVVAVTEMMKEVGINVNSYIFISEISFLNGRKRITDNCGNSNIFSLLKS